MLLLPAFKDEAATLATPLVNGTLAIVLLPSKKFTCSPSGGGPIIELTVAVKITVWPNCEGFCEEVRLTRMRGEASSQQQTPPQLPFVVRRTPASLNPHGPSSPS